MLQELIKHVPLQDKYEMVAVDFMSGYDYNEA